MTDPGPSEDGERPDLTITQLTGRICVVRMVGDLDMLSAPGLQHALSQEVAARHQVLLMDLSDCEFMGSAGLAVLVQANELAKPAGTHVALGGVNSIVDRALQITGLRTLFDVYSTLEAAVSALSDR